MPAGGSIAGAGRRILLKISFLILLIATANVTANWIVDLLALEIRPSTEDTVHRIILLSATAYTFLIAIPFVPGVEIGLTLIGILGPKIVFLVYVCTLAGLSIAFFAGRLIPLNGLIRLLGDLGLHRAKNLLSTIESMTMQERLRFLTSKAPNRYLPFLLRHRYIALAVLINLPGNIVIGGGGGIALMAGASRLYSATRFAATIVIAVSPLPLAILWFGKDFL